MANVRVSAKGSHDRGPGELDHIRSGSPGDLSLFDTSHATYQSGTRKQDAQQQARLTMDEMVRALAWQDMCRKTTTRTRRMISTRRRGSRGTAKEIAAFGSLEGDT